jgi:ribose 5-phosphate isomerase B
MRRLYTEADIPPSGELLVAVSSIITPAARETALRRGVSFKEVPADELPGVAPEKTIAIGSDHGGFRLKQELIPVIDSLGLAVRDAGVDDESPADYPDIALKVAELVASGAAARGVIIDGAGIGSAITANKVPGIRASLCYDAASARNAREHNDANVLTLGGRLITTSQAETVLRAWLGAKFAGGRHQGRVDKITAIEERFAR